MSGGEIATAAGVVITGISLVVVIIKYNQDKGKRDGSLQNQIENFESKLDTVAKNQEKTNKMLSDHTNYCSGFTARTDQRLTHVEKEVFTK